MDASCFRLAQALPLGKMAYRLGPPVYMALHWPLHLWAKYNKSRPAVLQYLDFSTPLTFSVQGGGSPTFGGSWAVLPISLATFGEKARSLACLWGIGLPACSKKEIQILRER